MKRQAETTLVLTREALSTMLVATAESYPKESIGLMFGTKPSMRRRRFHCISAVPFQMLRKRGLEEGAWFVRNESRIRRLQEQLSGLRWMGMFHSHSRIGRHPYPSLMPSKDDIESWMESNYPVELIVGVNLRRKAGKPYWRQLKDGTLSGKVGNFDFRIRGFVDPPNAAKVNVESPVVELYNLVYGDHTPASRSLTDLPDRDLHRVRRLSEKIEHIALNGRRTGAHRDKKRSVRAIRQIMRKYAFLRPTR
jgi:proteasome lid subunit RPN8/RPN11